MAVHDRSTGLGRVDRGIGDLLAAYAAPAGCGPVVPPEPVTAQVMKTSRFIASGIDFLPDIASWRHDLDCPIIHRLAKHCFALYEFQLMKSESPSIFLAERAPLKVTFLVFSGSSIMCVASAVDPLRAANRICGETHVRLEDRCRSTATPPVTTCGLPVAVSGAFDRVGQDRRAGRHRRLRHAL